MSKPLSILYFGTPRFSVFVLEALVGAGYTPAAVVTTPDRPAGRGLKVTESPIKEWSLAHDLPVIQPESLKKDSPELDLIKNTEWDLFVVAGYGKILPQELITLPRLGALNVHPSLLPRFRGPSPIESQILSDEREVGVTVLLMDDQMDHGPIVAQARITPDPWPVKTHVLEDILWAEGGTLLTELLPDFIAGTITPEPQDHEKATTTTFMKKEDGHLDPHADPYQNYLKYCAYDGWPGTYFVVERHGKTIRVKVNEAKFENGEFTILRVTPEGKREMSYDDYLRSA